MSGRLPDFIIIGAMKCGTTMLHDQLGRRSRLFMSEPKEPNFFSDDAAVKRGLQGYQELFATAPTDHLCGESSTHYTKLPTYPTTVSHLRAHVPKAKLVYVMRDPIDRIVSQYLHEWSRREVVGSLERVLRRDDRFVAYSSYALQLTPFLKDWGPERVLPVCFERMMKSPDQELRRVCDFIGDPSEEAASWHHSHGRQNASVGRMRKGHVREALLAIPGFRTMKDKLPRTLRNALKAPWQVRARPELSMRLRRMLAERLDPDLAQLGTWLGLELSCGNWSELALRPLSWANTRAFDAPATLRVPGAQQDGHEL